MRIRIRNRILLSMVGFLVLAACCFSFSIYWVQRQALENGIHRELYTAAMMAKAVLPPNYHDRIYNKSSIPDEEYQMIVDHFNKLCVKTNLEYLWSLMILDGKTVFTSATSPSKDVTKRDHAGFLDVHSNPELYTKVFQTMQPQYQINNDRWGRIQAILVPYRDRHGRPYLIGASQSMKIIDNQLRQTLIYSLLAGLLIVILGLLVFYLLANSLAHPIERMTEIATGIAGGDFSLSLPTKGPLEMQMLCESINAMSREIQKRLTELAASRENLDITLHSIGDGVISTDIKGRVTMMNKVAEELTGWSLGEATDQPFEDVFHIINEQTRYRCVNPIEKVLATGAIVGLANHTVLIARDGTERNIADSGAPIRDQNGNLVGTVLVFRDVTEKHRADHLLQESEEHFHSLFDCMTEGVALHELVFDDQCVPIDYRIIDINPQFERIVGISKSQAVGQVATLLYGTDEPPYAERYFRVALTHQPESFETYFPPLEKFFSISVAPWGDNGFATIFTDITEAKTAAKALEEKTDELDRFFSLALDLLCIADSDGYFIRLNRAWEKTLGYNLEDLEGQRFLDFVHPKDLDKTLEAIAILSNHRGIIDFTNRYRCKDGSYRWIEWRSAPYQEKLIYAVARDITDRKLAEEALIKSEEKLSKVFHLSPDWISISRLADGIFIDVNQGFTKISGYTAQEAIGHSSLPGDMDLWVNQEDRNNFITVLRKTGEIFEHESAFRRKDGSQFIGNISTRIIEIDGIESILTIIRDITERKQADEAMKKSEEKFSKTFHTSPDAIGINLQKSGVFLNVNQGFTDIFGYTAEEVIGHSSLPNDLGIWVSEEDRNRLFTDLRVKDEARDIEAKLRRKDGSIFIGSVSAKTIDLDGEPCSITVTRDITLQKQAEEALRKSEEKFSKAFHISPDSVIISRLNDGALLDVNHGFTTMLGYTADEALGHSPLPSDLGIWLNENERTQRMGYLLASGEVNGAEIQCRRKDGVVLTCSISAKIIEINGETCVLSIMRDITESKKAEEALMLSEEKFSKAFRISPDSININRLKDGVYIDCNQGFTDIMGYTPEDVLGRSSLPGDLGIWVNADDRRQLLDALREKGEMVGLEAAFRHKDGRTIIGLMSARIIDINGEKCILSITRDITERKQMETALRESEEKYRYMTENTSDIIWHLDRDYRFDYISPADERLRGFAQEEVIGTTVWSLFRPEGIDHIKQVNAKRLADEAKGIRTGTIRFELEQICKDGRWIWSETNVSPHYDQNMALIGLYGVSRDITDRKQVEEKINHLNAELEQRVHERTAQLEAANKELEAFAYSVSHDLRAPLRGIDGWSMILKEEYGGDLDGQANQYLDRVRAETQRMGNLIDDLLKLSRITRSEMRWNQVDLSAMAKTIAGRLIEAQPGREVEFIIQPGLMARADGALLEIALSNLLNNAFKFTGTKPQARIEFGQLPGKNKTFFIRDNGVGFDMQYAQRLFGAFQRMHKATEFPGSGIGLATVQRIIHRHGGTIWAESKLDQGTTFFFRLQGGK